jgi:hypothetical protein
MMTLLRAGFFRELRHGRSDGPSLAESVQASSKPEADQIASYLDDGEVLATTGSMVDDYLDASRQSVAKLEIVTDGVWVWPRDLAYYVGEYGVEVPDEFVTRVRARSWHPPALTPRALELLEEEYTTTLNPPAPQ